MHVVAHVYLHVELEVNLRYHPLGAVPLYLPEVPRPSVDTQYPGVTTLMHLCLQFIYNLLDTVIILVRMPTLVSCLFG